MNWCMLLAVASIACPWTRNTCRTYYWSEPMPVYVTCQPTPVCTYPSTMVCGPVVAEVCEETKEVAVKEEDPVTEAVAATEEEEEDEEDVTEFVDFSAPGTYGGGDMALDWGVAAIGAGTLYPTPQGFTGGGGFFPWGSQGTSTDGSTYVAPSVPPTIINNIINNNTTNVVNPIPEPASILAWGAAMTGAGFFLWRRRRSARSS